MRLMFWTSIVLIVYTYVGYPLGLWFRRRWRTLPIQSRPFFPSISILLVVRDEGRHLKLKMQSLLDIDYPSDLVQIIVVSDGSSDDTHQILAGYSEESQIHSIFKTESCGKASGLNDAFGVATGEILVFTDARQIIANGAIARLVENFADPSVGCASGELILGDPISGETMRGMGLYWKIEKFIRQAESSTGSVVGATGALYAARRGLVSPMPPDILVDDVFIPMQIARQGARVVFDSRARIWDVPHLGTKREFLRKVRTLTGIYQLLKLQPWVLRHDNPLRFAFISHKLLRLAVPFALLAIMISSLLLPSPIYRIALSLQLALYTLSALRLFSSRPIPLSRLADAAFTFVLLNAAALVAFGNFIAGRKPAWGR